MATLSAMSGDTDPVLARAADLTAAGDNESAVRLLRQVLTSDSENSEAWCRLATAQLAAGSATHALAAARRALQLNADPGWAYRLISLALTELGRGAEAVSAAREAVHSEPENWRTHVTLASSLAEHRSPAEALEPARTAAKLAPEHSRPHEVLGELAERAGEQHTAERAYRSALQLDPRSKVAGEGLERLRTHGVTPAPRPASGSRNLPATRSQSVVRPSPRAPSGRVSSRLATQLAFSRLLIRGSVCLGAGSLVLLLAGLPTPTQPLAWVGLVVLLACLGIVVFGLREIPDENRWQPRTWWNGASSLVVGAVALGVAALFVSVWAIALALGGTPPRLLPYTLCCTLVSGLLGLLGSPHRTRLWRKGDK